MIYLLILVGAFLFPGCRLVKIAEVLSEPRVTLASNDRILVIAPHPDDEVLGCGGILQDAVRMKLPIRILFLTNGDNNQWAFTVYRKHPVFDPKEVERLGVVRHDE